MLNDTGQDSAGTELSPETTRQTRSGVWTVLVQILLIALSGLYLAGVVWLYIQLPWLALIATAVAAGIILNGVVSRTRTPPSDC